MLFFIDAVFCGCLETDCKLNSELFEGCETYNLIESGRKPCPEGIIYTCCENSSSSDTVQKTLNEIGGSSESHYASDTVPYVCWDTGCQSDLWAVKGCAQYGMTETGQKSCTGGKIYSCCGRYLKSMLHSNLNLTMNSTSITCWDTGCQLNSWAIRGCAQYGMTEIGQKACSDGIIYTCCDNELKTTLNSTPNPVLDSTTVTCWDTGCQLKSWAVKGCTQYGRFETNQKSCPGGLIYTCCSNFSNSEPNSVYETCWDTGCQLNKWAIRGCTQYGMVETGQKPCADGIIYTCCGNSSKPTLVSSSNDSSSSTNNTCWKTGCQLNTWAVRGCAQYGMNEIGQKPCPGGTIYSCCGNTSVSNSVSSSCWDTGCQLNSWMVKGCSQYNLVETSRKQCPNGVIYTCCPSSFNSTSISVSTLSSESIQDGYLNYYKFEFTACGRVYTDDDLVAAVASSYFTSNIPQEDSLCGRQVKITDPSSGNNVIAMIVDRCKTCKENDIYVSFAVFKQLGRIPVSWSLI